jgi:hypothetical protein
MAGKAGVVAGLRLLLFQPTTAPLFFQSRHFNRFARMIWDSEQDIRNAGTCVIEGEVG